MYSPFHGKVHAALMLGKHWEIEGLTIHQFYHEVDKLGRCPM